MDFLKQSSIITTTTTTTTTNILLLLLSSSSSSPLPASARTPGSTDIREAVAQIQDAAEALRHLRETWDRFAVVDSEGRAGSSTDGARRILGGIAPQSGTAAIEAAKATPLYRIDGAFGVVRRVAILEGNGEFGTNRPFADLDLLRYNELVEDILYEIQKADGDCYSVLFASKGSKQISGIFAEAKAQIDQGVANFDELIDLLRQAGGDQFMKTSK